MEASTIFLLLWSFAWMVLAIFLHTANKALGRMVMDQERRNQVVESALIAVITYEQFCKYIQRDIKKFREGLKI